MNIIIGVQSASAIAKAHDVQVITLSNVLEFTKIFVSAVSVPVIISIGSSSIKAVPEPNFVNSRIAEAKGISSLASVMWGDR